MTGYPNLMILAFLLRYNDRKYIYNYVCVVPLFVFPRPNNNDFFQKVRSINWRIVRKESNGFIDITFCTDCFLILEHTFYRLIVSSCRVTTVLQLISIGRYYVISFVDIVFTRLQLSYHSSDVSSKGTLIQRCYTLYWIENSVN